MKYTSALYLFCLCLVALSTAHSRQWNYDYEGYNISVTGRPNVHGVSVLVTKNHSAVEPAQKDIILERFYKSLAHKNHTCPDSRTQIITFAPNVNKLEQNVTNTVYQFAQSKNWYTVALLVENATRDNFLDYASCPNLVALFYDGDADTQFITTYDLPVSHIDIGQLQWNYNVTTYWLACQAFNPPMLDAVTAAQPRRWAAGRNDLQVGPSDRAAAHAMIQAINGSCLAESFDIEARKYDQILDIWGYGGYGPNMLVNDERYPMPCGGTELRAGKGP